MDKFKNVLIRRIVFFCFYSVAVLVFAIIGLIAINNQYPWANENMISFDIGVSAGIEIVMVYNVAKYAASIGNNERLKKLYIEETDERAKYISSKIGCKGLTVVMLSLLLAGIIAGYFNITVFITLIAAAVFCALVTVSLKLYYNKKY